VRQRLAKNVSETTLEASECNLFSQKKDAAVFFVDLSLQSVAL
jgi:hypothetical protein